MLFVFVPVKMCNSPDDISEMSHIGYAPGTPFKMSCSPTTGAVPPYSSSPNPYNGAVYPVRSTYPQQNPYAQVSQSVSSSTDYCNISNQPLPSEVVQRNQFIIFCLFAVLAELY